MANRKAFAFTWTLVGHGVDEEDAFEDVLGYFEGITIHNATDIEEIGTADQVEMKETP